MKITKDKVDKALKKLRFKFPYEAEDWMNNLYMENYHYHTDFSNNETPDSAENQQNYAAKVKEYKAKCLYSGEHGSQGNQFETYKICEKEGLKYRHSAEAYWVKNRHEKDRANCHMMIIAKNPEGRKDMNYILSKANEDGFYYRPRIDLELLLSIPKDNVIVTSACIAGWRYEDAEGCWLKVAEHFGDNFFCEVQYHNTSVQRKAFERVIKFATENNLQLIAGLDSHYTSDERSIMRDQVLKYKKTQFNDDEDGMYMDFPNTETVIQRFEEQGILSEEQILEAVLNTNVFVKECEEITLDRKFKIPNIYKNLDYQGRVKLYKQKLNSIYKTDPIRSKEKKQGIQWEVEQIVDSNTVDYMLFSEAVVEEAIKNYGGVLTTTGRGSAASFVTNKMIGLTTIDRFNSDIPLFPERFLTKDRILAGSMPDIDNNIESQEPFIEAARNLLGYHGCYPLMTLSKLKEKAAWQLYAGANDVTPSDSLAISKAIDVYNDKIKYSEDEDKAFIKIDDYIPKEFIEIYKQSLPYQGITLKCGKHACGFLVFDGDIRREIGLVSAKNETTGERVLVAAVEGQYLDEFGYVKEDFLIVDVVGLIKELWESIGESVPTFERLKELVLDDEKTWDIYAKGITCCINQCEKEGTTKKLQRYKPKNIAELSSFIAGIRPGFKSLINNFIARRHYSTGEVKIDELLKDSSHYMIFQESIMKILSFLGLPMTETYSVIKSISKKKLKGKKRDDLMIQLKRGWEREFGNLDNFSNVWQVIEDAAAYSFNAAHAYSMAGDSLYCAWFKAHFPAKFYEVAIRHYQAKNKKDKVSDLLDEAAKFYGFKQVHFEWGQDNRTIHIDEDKKLIYPNLSSLKGFGENVAVELWNAFDPKLDNFIEVLLALRETSINKSLIETLINIDYFKCFGEIEDLINIYQLFLLFNRGKTKTIKIEKAEAEELINIKILEKYSNKTTKQYSKIDSISFLKESSQLIKGNPISIRNRLINQIEVLGYLDYSNPQLQVENYFVIDLQVKKKIAFARLKNLNSGEEKEYKLWMSDYKRCPFEKYDLLRIPVINKECKRQPSDEINTETGKKIWKPIPNEFEYFIKTWTVVKEPIYVK